jgi:hypothetical protein
MLSHYSEMFSHHNITLALQEILPCEQACRRIIERDEVSADILRRVIRRHNAYILAQSCAEVILSGNGTVYIPDPNTQYHALTKQEMYEAIHKARSIVRMEAFPDGD